jgi:hypothetical protein
VNNKEFRLYVQQVVAECPGIPMLEEARLYHGDPRRPWARTPWSEKELLDSLEEIADSGEQKQQQMTTKRKLRAILSLLLNHCGINVDEAVEIMQRRGSLV